MAGKGLSRELLEQTQRALRDPRVRERAANRPPILIRTRDDYAHALVALEINDGEEHSEAARR